MHTRGWKVVNEMSNYVRPEHKNFKLTKEQIALKKLNRKWAQKLAGRKIVIDPTTGMIDPVDLKEEAEKAYKEKEAAKAKYQKAKAEGRLRTKEKK